MMVVVKLTGWSMQRSRTEALEIVRKNHKDISQQNELILVSHYMRTNDWSCRNCFQTGTLIKVNGSVKTSDCICRIIRRRNQEANKIKLASNIPNKYHDADIKKWENPGLTPEEIEVNNQSFKLIESYAKNVGTMIDKGNGLYLSGPNGVGKTYLACSIANKAANIGKKIKYYTMNTIIQTEIRGWRDEDSALIMRGIKKSDLLIIDDLDKIYKTSTGIEKSLFDNLLRERLQANKPCIFTSNRTMTDARLDYGSHISSMLTEHCAELVLVGQDYRKKMAEKVRRSIENGG
jgi:DNA replication protein DnaC